MNLLLWVLQVLLALHTAAGAVWKLSNSQLPFMRWLPRSAWIALAGFELACAVALILPGLFKTWKYLAPWAAAAVCADLLFIAAMLMVQGYGAASKGGPAWIEPLAAALLAAFVAWGRLALKPL